VLSERAGYIDRELQENEHDELLNLDLLASILDQTFSPNNKSDAEDYAYLLQDFVHFDIKTVAELESLFQRHMDSVLAEEREMVENYDGWQPEDEQPDNRRPGVYFTHAGLARSALQNEVGLDTYKAWAH